jgi:hypothetical protein
VNYQLKTRTHYRNRLDRSRAQNAAKTYSVLPGGRIQFYDSDPSPNTHTLALRVPSSLLSNQIWYLPDSDAIGPLCSDGAGTMSFASCEHSEVWVKLTGINRADIGNGGVGAGGIIRTWDSTGTTVLNRIDQEGGNFVSLRIGGTEVISSARNVVVEDLTVNGTCTNCTSATGVFPVVDTTVLIRDNVDTTKRFRFEATNITTGTTRVFTVQDANYTIAGTNFPNTFTENQTFHDSALLAAGIVNIGQNTAPIQDLFGTQLYGKVLAIADPTPGNNFATTWKWSLTGPSTLKLTDNGPSDFLWASSGFISGVRQLSVDALLTASANNTWDLGASSNRWKKVWAVDMDFSGSITGNVVTTNTIQTITASKTFSTADVIAAGTSNIGTSTGYFTDGYFGGIVHSKVFAIATTVAPDGSGPPVFGTTWKWQALGAGRTSFTDNAPSTFLDFLSGWPSGPRQMIVDASLTPATSLTRTLGSATAAWSHVYAGAVTASGDVHIGGNVGVGVSPGTYKMNILGDVNVSNNYRQNGVVVIDTFRNATVQNLTINGTCTGCGSSAPANMMTTDTTQNVSGSKTFLTGPIISNTTIQASGTSNIGTSGAPFTDIYGTTVYGTNLAIGDLFGFGTNWKFSLNSGAVTLNDSGPSTFLFMDSGAISGQRRMLVYANLLPSGSRSLGASGSSWLNGYIGTLYVSTGLQAPNGQWGYNGSFGVTCGNGAAATLTFSWGILTSSGCP